MSSPIRSSTSPTSAFDGQASPGEISWTVRTPASVTVRWSGIRSAAGPRKPIGPSACRSAMTATSALQGSCTRSQSNTSLRPLRRRRDAAHLVQRPALERGSSPAATRGPAARRARRSSRRRRRARHPRRWPRRPPVAGRGRRCRGSAAWPAGSPTGLGASLRSSWCRYGARCETWRTVAPTPMQSSVRVFSTFSVVCPAGRMHETS